MFAVTMLIANYAPPILVKANYKYIEGFNDKNLKAGTEAFKRTCQKLGQLKSKIFTENIEIWKNICENIAPSSEFYAKNFSIFRVLDLIDTEAFYTGYYEIALIGSRNKSEKYRFPLYKLPKEEFLELKREEIEAGALKNKDLEIVYVDDPAKLFFLHVQGSGKITLDDGKVINVGFAGKNKHEYESIGKYFLENDIFERDDISALKIMDWIRDNEKSAAEIMNKNPSYIFFEERENGATGSLGVELVPEGSIAVDREKIPLGIPLFITTRMPNGKKYNKLLNAQDTGSAIKGILRGDIFFGFGQKAENSASVMKQYGKKYFLIPKDINPQQYF